MKIDRRTYADHYGPTTGDRIRLADTDLIIEIEDDATTYGDEAKFGGGKVIRDGMGQSTVASRAAGSPDLVITNAVIVDSVGIRKADVGIRDGRISAIGKAGNPGIMDGVSPGLVISASTEVLAGEGHILTAGAIDSHMHVIGPFDRFPLSLKTKYEPFPATWQEQGEILIQKMGFWGFVVVQAFTAADGEP